MTEQAYYIVKNWEKFQHYKDRNPPWIKLHYELLSSTDWVILNDASRVLAIACMLVASRNNGHVPTNPNYLKRVAYLNRKPNFKPLIDCGFLEIPLADASTIQASARPETYSEYREETDTHTTARGAFQEIFDEGCAVNPQLAAKSTAVIHQWVADGVTPEDAVPEVRRLAANARSWTFFTGAVMDAKATRLNPLPQGFARANPETESIEQKIERLSKTYATK